jgi:hypothetical protein
MMSNVPSVHVTGGGVLDFGQFIHIVHVNLFKFIMLIV